EHSRQQSGCGNTDESRGVCPCHQSAAMGRGEHFAEICIRQWDFGTDTYACNKTGDHYHCSVDAECRNDGEERVNAEVDQESRTTPKAIGYSAQQRRSSDPPE